MSFLLDKVCRFRYFLDMKNVAKPKLNPLHVLNFIETLISEMSWTTERHFKICMLNNRIQIIPANKTTLPNTVFLKFSESDLWNGFTAGQWNKILTNATKMIKKGELCRKHLKL